MAFIPFVELDDNVTDAGDLVSVELFKTLSENCNYLLDSMPVGCIVPIAVGLAGVPTPDPLIWQECDGALVQNENSPLHGQNVPDYTDGRYIRGFDTVGTIGFMGGSNSKTLSHDHSGHTDGINIPDKGDQQTFFWPNPKNHNHTVSSDLGTYDFQPVHIRIKHFIKIL